MKVCSQIGYSVYCFITSSHTVLPSIEREGEGERKRERETERLRERERVRLSTVISYVYT